MAGQNASETTCSQQKGISDDFCSRRDCANRRLPYSINTLTMKTWPLSVILQSAYLQPLSGRQGLCLFLSDCLFRLTEFVNATKTLMARLA